VGLSQEGFWRLKRHVAVHRRTGGKSQRVNWFGVEKSNGDGNTCGMPRPTRGEKNKDGEGSGASEASDIVIINVPSEYVAIKALSKP